MVNVICDREGIMVNLAGGFLYSVTLAENPPGYGWTAFLVGFPGGMVGNGETELIALVELFALIDAWEIQAEAEVQAAAEAEAAAERRRHDPWPEGAWSEDAPEGTWIIRPPRPR